MADRLGGPCQSADELRRRYHTANAQLKQAARSAIIPIGALAIGAARQRALLFKVLADAHDVSCQLLRGQHWAGDEDAAVNVVRIDGRDWVVDLVRAPGRLTGITEQMEQAGKHGNC